MIFVNDHKFVCGNDGQYYTTGTLTDEVWKRYISVFGKVTVCAHLRNKAADQESIREGQNVRTIRMHLVPLLKHLPIGNPFLYRKTIEKILSSGDQYIVIRAPSILGSIAANYCRKMGKPYLVELAGCPLDTMWNYSLKGKLLSLYFYLITWRVVKHADYAIYVTNNYLQKRYPCDGVTTNISNVLLQDIDDNVVDRRKNHIKQKKDKIILGMVGALDAKDKGQKYLVAAMKHLKGLGFNNYELQLVGGGDSSSIRKKIRANKVENSVRLLGRMPHDAIFGWFEDIDIYIQAGFTEGLPRAMIEAMSKAVPCIGGNGGGIPELIDSQWLYAAKPGRAKQLAEKILQMTSEMMLLQSEKNFETAKQYERNTLEEKRRKFLERYKENVDSVKHEVL